MLGSAFFVNIKAQSTCQAGFTSAVNANTATFTNTSTGGASNTNYYWDFGDGNSSTTSTPQSQTHQYVYNGLYQVCVFMSDSSIPNGCFSSFCDSIVITGANPPCNLSLSAIGLNPSSPTANDGAVAVNTYGGTPPYNYLWTPGGYVTDSVAGLGNGCYAVLVTDATGCTKNASVCISDSSNTPCNLSLSTNGVNPSSATANDGIVSVAVAGGTAPYNYLWTPGNYATSTAQGVGNGCYNVTVTDATGCTKNASVCIYDSTGTSPCMAQFYATPDSNNTISGTVDFFDYSTGVPTSWSWNFGDGNTSNQQDPTHVYAQSGTYQVCLTITTSAGTCSSCSNVTVNANPVSCSASMYLVQDSANSLTWYAYTYITGVAPFTYLWNFGDGSTSTQQYPSHNYTTAGNYLICLTITDAIGCSSTTCDSTNKLALSGNMQYLVVMNTTGIEENPVSVNSIFPNPASDVVDISLSQLVKGSLMITDMIGREVYSENINSDNVKLNVSNLPIGYYNLSIVSGAQMSHSKIVIVR
jgi:PKD repeat protein